MSANVEDQIDTCRICSGPAEPGEPLFHPCKCSGTIRYIHQDCLTTWLQHSKKVSCDVCKTEYSFQKVYDPNMPERLPALLFIRRLAVQIFHWTLFALRTIAIATIWLAFLPYTTVWVWRFYFWTGEHIAWRMYGEERPSLPPPPPMNGSISANVTAPVSSLNRTAFLGPILSRLSKSEAFQDVWGDILTGQIIAALIIVLFLAVFLLREWIVQNARPGIFGEPVVADGVDDVILPGAGAMAHEGDRQAQAVNQGGPQLGNAGAFPPAQALGGQPAFRFLNGRLEPGRQLEQRRAERVDGAPVPERDGLGRAVHHRVRQRFEAQRIAPRAQFGEAYVPQRTGDEVIGPPNGAVSDDSVDQLSHRSSELEQDFYIPDPNPEIERVRMRIRREKYFARPGNGGRTAMKSDMGASPRYSFTSAPSSPSGDSTATSSEKPFPTSWDLTVPPYLAIPLPPSPESTAGPLLEPPQVAEEIPTLLASPIDPAAVPLPSSPCEEQHDDWEDRTPRWVQKQAERSSDHGDEKWQGFPLPLTPDSRLDDESDIFARKARVSTSSWDSWGQTESPSTSSTSHHPGRNPFNEVAPLPASADLSISGSSVRPMAPIPRRPQLPPTTPNEELPPPSPRPSHAQPSPLPSSSGADLALERTASHPGFSKLRDVTTPSPLDFGKATYRAPEDLDAESSYFHVAPRVVEVDSDETGSDDQDVDWRMEPPDDIVPQVGALQAGEHQPIPRLQRLQRAAIANEVNRIRQQNDNEAAGQNWDVNMPNNDEADMVEGGEDDMDGLLEAVGMRGPLLAVVQNVALIIFILDMTIGGAVWIPFTIGRSLALNLMKPRRLLFVLHLPIRIVRLATDPVVDLFLWFLRPAVTHLFKVLSEVWKLRTSNAPKSTIHLDSIYYHVSRRLTQIFPFIGSKDTHSISNFNKLLALIPDLTPYEPYIPIQFKTATRIGDLWTRDLYGASRSGMAIALAAVGSRWRSLATGTGPSEQLFSVLLGYTTILALAGSFLASGLLYSGASTIIRNAVTQQLIVVKVAVFILIELVVFPFGCGVILDISTLPLFGGATIWTRLEYSAHAPLTAAFFHWMLGTMFMYQFAMLLAACRGLMRKGAMWFIKDPADPSFHPIRDILDRPALSQLRKLGVSALMYSFVILGGVGTAIYFLRYFWTPFNTLLPLRWDAKNPLSEIPIDLLFLHIVAPAILESIKLRDAIVRGTTVWWEHAAHELRLTSYMFGVRPAEEELQSIFSWRRLPIIRDQPWVGAYPPDALEPVRDGLFVRAPAGDAIAFPENERQMLVTTDENGTPLDDEGRRLIEVQNSAAAAAHRNVADDYAVVYLPPHFKYRVMVFTLYLWVTGVFLATATVGTPILFGRLVLGQLVGRAAHDGYSFIIGASSFWAFITVWNFVNKRYRGLQIMRRVWRDARAIPSAFRTTETQPDISSLDPLYLETGRIMIWIGKIVILAITLGFVIPLFLALVVELYIILPIRIGLFVAEERAPTVYIWEDWALGLVLFNIALRMARLQNPPAIVAAWDAIVDNGVTGLDFYQAMTEFVWPVTSGLLVMIVAPGFIPFILTRVFQIEVPDHLSIRTIYPTIFVGACLATIASAMVNYLERWAQTVRDSEFLITKRLQNLEPDPIQSELDASARRNQGTTVGVGG